MSLRSFASMGALTPNAPKAWIIPLLLIFAGAWLQPSTVQAQPSMCNDELELRHSFSSGAAWSLCASASDIHGLTVSSVHYRAPGDTSRAVLDTVHLGQLLLHYHDSPTADAQIRPTVQSPDASRDANGPSSATTVAFTDLTCGGERLGAPDQPDTLCAVVKDNRTLAKYAQRPSLHSQSWELASAFARDALIWTVAITFTEDGQIQPAVRVSGRTSRTSDDDRFSTPGPAALPALTRATVLSTWRMVFNLDTDAADRVEQFDFPLDTSRGNRRPMQVTAVNTESLQNIDRENFRGWRVVDASGAGYYLDPANSGFSYTSQSLNWAQFDMAFTRLDACERHALLNTSSPDTPCGTSLDDFVNGESLENGTPVLWYSQMRNLNLTLEDWPVISELTLSFDLLPFDWTGSSPFELVE